MARERIVKEIDELMGRIGQTDYDNEDYQTYQDELKKWQEILEKYDAMQASGKKEKKARMFELLKLILDFAKTATAVTGTLIAICLIVYAENEKVLTSKAMQFVTKILPKVVA